MASSTESDVRIAVLGPVEVADVTGSLVAPPGAMARNCIVALALVVN